MCPGSLFWVTRRTIGLLRGSPGWQHRDNERKRDSSHQFFYHDPRALVRSLNVRLCAKADIPAPMSPSQHLQFRGTVDLFWLQKCNGAMIFDDGGLGLIQYLSSRLRGPRLQKCK